MKIIKYSDILRYDRIVHFSQKDISVQYDHPLIDCGLAGEALVVFCHNGENSLLERQCVSSNLPFVKLGHNIENWINTYKPFLFYEFLFRNRRALADRIILFLDAYDVILPLGLSRLIDVYKQKYYNYALFNATNASMRSGINGYHRKQIDKFENGLCGGGKFYLNAGVVIGDHRALLDTYRQVAETMRDMYPFHFRGHRYAVLSNDRAMKREQPFIRLSSFRNKSKIVLDYKNEITIRLRPTNGVMLLTKALEECGQGCAV